MRIPTIAAIATGFVLAGCATHADDDAETLSASADHILSCQKPLGFHLFEQQFECPIGGEEFTSLVIGTHSTSGRHLDWEPVSYMEFPAPLPVCPSNGFVVYKEDFSEDNLRALEAAIQSLEYRKEFKGKNASYYLFGRLLEITGDDEGYDLWWIFLNSTWEADQCRSPKYSRYALKTIDYAREVLAQQGETDDLYWILNIIIPNLYRRMGEFERARSWLDDLGEHRPGDEISNAEFFNLAFRLLDQAIEQRDQSQIDIKPPENETTPIQ